MAKKTKTKKTTESQAPKKAASTPPAEPAVTAEKGWRGFWARRTKKQKARVIFYPSLVLAIVGFGVFTMSMPGKSYTGQAPVPDDERRRLSALLRRDVEALAGAIGERTTEKKGNLDRAWERIQGEFNDAGYDAKPQRYKNPDGRDSANVVATLEGKGAGSEIVVIGAHYDSAIGAPGADDNASGVAVLLALARAFDTKPQRRTVRFVAFTNEEPPHFWNESMGSLHYAKACKAKDENIVAMLSLESLGYYSDAPGSQKYPPIVSWFYPSKGDFVAFVGNLSSRSLVRDSISSFRKAAVIPSEGAALPGFVTGVGWSDHWSFWQVGYPAIMVTDTAPFRNPNYHTANDKPETLDYERLARVTSALISVVGSLAN